MEPNKQPEPVRMTALQIWNAQLRKTLEDHMMVRLTRNRIIPIRKHIEKAEQAIQAAEKFEVTKLRRMIDAFIEKIESLKADQDKAKNSYDKTWLFQLRKRKTLKREYERLKTSIEVYTQASLLVVNTIPAEAPVLKDADIKTLTPQP